MGDWSKRSLFICYSRRDSGVVKPILNLQPDILEAAYIDLVDTLPGSDWKAEHEAAIRSAHRLILVWSQNSAKSSHVEREWKFALAHDTQIVPVFIDNTPLPPELSHINAISLVDYVSQPQYANSLARALFGLSSNTGGLVRCKSKWVN